METDFIGTMPQPLLTPIDLAKYLGISKATMQRLIAKRCIPFHKIGGSLRFKQTDVEMYLEKNRVKSVDEIICVHSKEVKTGMSDSASTEKDTER